MKKFLSIILSLVCIVCIVPISSSAADGTVTVTVPNEVWYMEDSLGLYSVKVTCGAKPTLYVYQNETEFAITKVISSLKIDPNAYAPKYGTSAKVDFYVDMRYFPTDHYTTLTLTFGKLTTGWGDISYGTITENSSPEKRDINYISYPEVFNRSDLFTCNYDYYGYDGNGNAISEADWYGLWFTLAEVKTLAGY